MGGKRSRLVIHQTERPYGRAIRQLHRIPGVKADKRRLNDQRVIVKALVLLHVVDDKRVGLQNGMGAK